MLSDKINSMNWLLALVSGVRTQMSSRFEKKYISMKCLREINTETVKMFHDLPSDDNDTLHTCFVMRCLWTQGPYAFRKVISLVR